VAKLAGIPESVIRRSKEILSELEIGTPNPYTKKDKQLNLFVPTANPSMQAVRARTRCHRHQHPDAYGSVKKIGRTKKEFPLTKIVKLDRFYDALRRITNYV